MAVIPKLSMLATVVLVAGCGTPPQAQPGEVLLPAPASVTEIEKITVTRDDRGGQRPDYSIDLLADGSALRNEMDPGGIRSWTAPYDTAAFRRLAQRVLDDGTFKWSSYQPMRREGSILIVIIAMTRHRYKEIEGRTGPHWPLGRTVDSIANTLQWTEHTH